MTVVNKNQVKKTLPERATKKQDKHIRYVSKQRSS
jgi:hypothetical protein